LNLLTKHLRLVRLMMREELRLNSGIVGRVQFLMFPVMMLVFSLVISAASPMLLANMPMDDVHRILHLLLFAYGFSVGGFAMFAQAMADRRFGSVTLMLSTPLQLPVSFRQVFAAFYVKDVIYYFFYSIVPLIGGMALSMPFTHFRAASLLFLMLTAMLAFLLGVSLSFALSSVNGRSRGAYLALAAVIGAAMVAALLGVLPLESVLPPLMLQLSGEAIYLLISVALILALSVAAVMTLEVKFGKSESRYEAEMIPTAKRLSRFSLGRLLAKDWIDLRRSRTLGPVMGAYVGPLALLALMCWFIEAAVDVSIPVNLIFYSAMIGFFSVSIYGWLNMLDAPAFLEVLPVKVSEMIRAKVMILAVFAGAMSTAFLIALGIFRHELSMTPVALMVGYASTAFTVCGTAYLTGLRTNSYLFDPKVLSRFAVMCVPPLIMLVLLSFSYPQDPLAFGAVLAFASAALIAGALMFHRGIESRWGRETFTW